MEARGCQFFRTIAGIAAPVAAVLCLGLVSPASAAPPQVSRDQADNGYSFSYNAPAADLTQQASSVLGRRGQGPSHHLGEGTEGLVGVISLTSSAADRRAVYDGTFVFKVSPRPEAPRS